MSSAFSLSSFLSASSSSHNFFHHGSLSLRISSLWHCCALVITGADLDVKASRLSGETSWSFGAAKKELNSNIYQICNKSLHIDLKKMKWIILWTVDEDEKVNKIFAVNWTTYTIEIESEKIPAWPGIEHWSLWCSSLQNVSFCTEPPSPQEKIRGGVGS